MTEYFVAIAGLFLLGMLSAHFSKGRLKKILDGLAVVFLIIFVISILPLLALKNDPSGGLATMGLVSIAVSCAILGIPSFGYLWYRLGQRFRGSFKGLYLVLPLTIFGLIVGYYWYKSHSMNKSKQVEFFNNPVKTVVFMNTTYQTPNIPHIRIMSPNHLRIYPDGHQHLVGQPGYISIKKWNKKCQNNPDIPCLFKAPPMYVRLTKKPDFVSNWELDGAQDFSDIEKAVATIKKQKWVNGEFVDTNEKSPENVTETIGCGAYLGRQENAEETYCVARIIEGEISIDFAFKVKLGGSIWEPYQLSKSSVLDYWQEFQRTYSVQK